MVKALALTVLLALGGCSMLPQHQHAASACASDPGGYQCQVDNYFRAP